MANGFSTAQAISILDAMCNTLTFYNSAILEIRDGTRPATADTAPTGTVLASITLPADAMAAASGHSCAKTGTWQDASADASGTATWFRIKVSGDAGTTNTTDKRQDGSVTATGGGGELTLDSTTITGSQPVTVTGFTWTLPA